MVNIFVDPKTKKGLPSSYWKTLKCQKKISLEEKDKGSECLSETLITKGIDHSSFFSFFFLFFLFNNSLFSTFTWVANHSAPAPLGKVSLRSNTCMLTWIISMLRYSSKVGDCCRCGPTVAALLRRGDNRGNVPTDVWEAFDPAPIDSIQVG